MASRKFRFVSPGVFLREIDNSQLPGISDAVGPIIIGRTRKGPAMKACKVRSLEELERVFGKPLPGNQGEDPWRDGTGLLAESYAPYAARAYLTAARNTDSPVTIVRLLGIQGDDATDADEAKPGWKAKHAYGLFLMESGSNMSVSDVYDTSSLHLGAVFYSTADVASVEAKGQAFDSPDISSSVGTPVKFDDSGKLTVVLKEGSGENERTREVRFNFENIRKEFNTNPVATNTRISSVVSGTLSDAIWLGESFEETYRKRSSSIIGRTGTRLGAVVLKLNSAMADYKGSSHEASAARTGWIFGQDSRAQTGSFDPTEHQRLFRVVSIHEGIESTKNLQVAIEDIQVPRDGATDRFGRFSVVVKYIGKTRVEILERFDNCNLDPSSNDFVAKKIGDQYYEWSPTEKRNKLSGEHPNISEHIRIEMNQDIINQGGPSNVEHVPFGFYGPIRPIKQSLTTGAGTAEVTKLIIKANTAAGHLDGKKILFRIEGDPETLVEYEFSAGAAELTASGSVIGFSGVAGTKEAVANSIRTQLSLQPALTDKLTIGTVAEESGDFAFSITQKNEGDIVTVAKTNAAGANSGIDDSNLTVTVTTAGSGSFNGTLSLSNWLSGTLNVTSIYDTPGKTINVCWADSPITNTASVTQDFYQGVSPYKLSYSTGAIDNSSTAGSKINPAYIDSFRKLSAYSTHASAQTSGIKDNGTEYSFIFSLDEVVLDPTRTATNVNGITSRGSVKTAAFVSGSRTGAGSSDEGDAGTTYKSYMWHVANGTGSIRTLLDIVDGFCMPLVGGYDGVDITEADPFNADVLNNGTTGDSYAYASVDRALELIKDPEAVEHNLALMPGITEESLTTKLVDICESRADSLAIIDLPDVYVPPFQKSCDNFQERIISTPESAARNLTTRQLNSSYGASYYPWVKIKDEAHNRDVWVPPSVVALGVMGYTEGNSEVWFAPAGFNRGGLNQGNAGVPVLQVTEQLLSKDRDTLYAANINPIASFVSEGLVIFGQKTLQSEQSALDRINVRRLLIFVKKEVSRISSNLLFEQNVQATWTRFSGQVKSFLESVKVRFGLTDFKVLLDSTTTTPDLIDRNVMYAKIFLKPARSIEFIAVDFVITNTGASFDD